MFMIPRKRDFNLLDDMFDDPFYEESALMKTDIKEKENEYIIDIDLPGYDKENIKVSIDDGYLTVHAKTHRENDEKEKGKFVRKERFVGECSRSFYVGEEIKQEEIRASFKNGILELVVPKKEERKELPGSKYIEIE